MVSSKLTSVDIDEILNVLKVYKSPEDFINAHFENPNDYKYLFDELQKQVKRAKKTDVNVAEASAMLGMLLGIRYHSNMQELD